MPISQFESFIETKSAKERIYDALKRWIIVGRLLPGEKLIDMDIASAFKVSRTPVREALQLLERQKLVILYPGKSTIVTEIDTEDIKKWYIPMMHLQKLAIGLAVENVNENDLEQLTGINFKFEELVKAKAPAIELLDKDKEFHDAILEIGGNSYIIDFCETLWIHIMRLEHAYFRRANTLNDSINHHKDMINALRMRDGLSAELAMENNWRITAITVQNIIDNKNF